MTPTEPRVSAKTWRNIATIEELKKRIKDIYIYTFHIGIMFVVVMTVVTMGVPFMAVPSMTTKSFTFFIVQTRFHGIKSAYNVGHTVLPGRRIDRPS